MPNIKEMFHKLPILSKDDNVLLLTHIDMDGSGPAIILKTLYPAIQVQHCGNGEMSDIIEHAVTDPTARPENCTVIIVCDISCTQAAADRINTALPKSGVKLILLDHHKTALHLNDYDWAVVSPTAPSDTMRKEYYNNYTDYTPLTSGTALLLDYLNYAELLQKNDEKRMKQLLSLTHMISAYDTWEWNDLFKADLPKQFNDIFLIYGVKRFEERMTTRVLYCDELITEFDKDMLAIEQDHVNEAVADDAKHIKEKDLTIDGRTYHCVISLSSENMAAMFLYMKTEYPDADLYIISYGTGISIRTVKPDIDVSAITLRRGGGGHPGAGGFKISEDVQTQFILSAMQCELKRGD